MSFAAKIGKRFLLLFTMKLLLGFDGRDNIVPRFGCHSEFFFFKKYAAVSLTPRENTVWF